MRNVRCLETKMHKLRVRTQCEYWECSMKRFTDMWRQEHVPDPNVCSWWFQTISAEKECKWGGRSEGGGTVQHLYYSGWVDVQMLNCQLCVSVCVVYWESSSVFAVSRLQALQCLQGYFNRISHCYTSNFPTACQMLKNKKIKEIIYCDSRIFLWATLKYFSVQYFSIISVNDWSFSHKSYTLR